MKMSGPGRFLISILISLILFSLASEEERVSASADDSWTIFRGTKNLGGVAGARLPAKLALAFKLETSDGITGTPVIWNRVLFIGALDGSLYAFDLDLRIKRWEFKISDSFEAPPLVVPGEGMVFIGANDGVFYALDAATGGLYWKAVTEGKIMGSANYFYSPPTGKTSVVVGSYDNLLYCFDARSGNLNWTYKTKNFVNGSPAVAGDLLTFGGCDARLHVLNVALGQETGVVDTGAYIAGSVCLVDNTAYIGNYNGRFLAIDVKKNTVRWSYQLESDSAGFVGSPAVSGDRVVIGAKDSQLYCFERETGTLLWKYRSSSGITSSPLIGGDRVLIAASDGELSLLDLAGGQLLSRYQLGAGVSGSPAFAAGFIAIGALDNRVYVFKGE